MLTRGSAHFRVLFEGSIQTNSEPALVGCKVGSDVGVICGVVVGVVCGVVVGVVCGVDVGLDIGVRVGIITFVGNGVAGAGVGISDVGEDVGAIYP